MAIDTALFNKPIELDTIPFELSPGQAVDIDILRLDKLHPTISGNKWFKLKYNLLEAKQQAADAVLSFGGAYSNHLHALAYAGKLFGTKTIGLVRGEAVDNPTLRDCADWGMELHFVSRSVYREKNNPDYLQGLAEQFPNTFIIPEGGDNALGLKGCTEILTDEQIDYYDLICCSIGTGTTIKGLGTTFLKPIWGFTSLKNATALKQDLNTTLPQLRYIDAYHWGGFGKFPPELAQYMELFYKKYTIELDQVYTAKMFFGLQQELLQHPQVSEQKILVVHTGGLQGNRSGQIQ